MLFIVLGLVISASIADIQLNSSSEYTAGNFIANALMLQAVPPYEAWNGPAWSVCAELAAYLAFPLIALWIARIRVAIHGFLASAIVLVTGTGVMLVTATYVNPSPTGYELIWLRISTEFTAGALIYGGWRHLGRFKQGSGWDWMAGISFFGIAVIIWITEEANQFALASVPLIGVFILSCAGATGWIGSILRCRFMVWGGKVSYSVYMTHFILLMVFGKVLPWEAFEDAALPLRLGVMGGYYLLVILTGAVCFYLLEEPARRGLRRLSDARLVGQPLEKFRQRSTRT